MIWRHMMFCKTVALMLSSEKVKQDANRRNKCLTFFEMNVFFSSNIYYSYLSS